LGHCKGVGPHFELPKKPTQIGATPLGLFPSVRSGFFVFQDYSLGNALKQDREGGSTYQLFLCLLNQINLLLFALADVLQLLGIYVVFSLELVPALFGHRESLLYSC
jgi:hypothetical protein